MEDPKTLLEAVRQFADPQVAHDYFVALRWPNGIACPRMGCGSADVARIKNRNAWRCRECNRQFTAKVGTVFEESPIGFDKWLPAMWLISANRNGISSCEVARGIGVTQKTAWFMLHRLRHAMQTQTFEKLEGTVEADETFIGGQLKYSKRIRREIRRGNLTWNKDLNKTRVLGAVQRGGKVRAWVIPDLKKATMLPKLRDAVTPDSTLYTDGSGILYLIGKEFAHHDWVNHALEYVRGNVHTQNIEAFWSVLKRTIGGTYTHVNARHLDRYLAEQIYRFNERKNTDGPRFTRAAKAADGARLTWKALVEKNAA
jgi:transposase-like protein